MSPRVLAAAVATLSALAFAQSDDYSPPPMVPVDAPADHPPPTPPSQQPQQPQQQQPQSDEQLQEQSHQPVQPLPADYVPPQQQYPQQPQYDPQQYQQQQYQQAPPTQPRKRQRAEAEPVFEGTPLESRRTKHFLALASGNIGLFTQSPDLRVGTVFNVRAEADIGKIPLFVGYSWFTPDTADYAIGHFTAMTGWSFFSRDEITWRALGGVDVIDNDGLIGTGVVFGTTFRSMFARSVGVDLAAMFTPFPFRQLELRGAIVFQFWVMEIQLGWRFQAIDATQGGNLGTLFDIAPSVNGPSAGIGLTF
ncbi:MAG: hypothetical protein ACO1OB_27985 [Archangium sp.]